MDTFIKVAIGICSGILGGFLVVVYNTITSARQEKAILVILIEECILLLQRATNYYRQSLQNNVSFSTLFEISDSSTFIKFAEVGKNNKIIETSLKLKADFFQVIRYTHKASDAIAESQMASASGDLDMKAQKEKEARTAQSLALVFFVGDSYYGDGTFNRKRYEEFVSSIQFLLDYLKERNDSKVYSFINKCFENLKTNMRVTEEFIKEQKEVLNKTEKELDELREIERASMEKSQT